MNKNHWITIILNNSLPNDVLFAPIDKSFDLAKKQAAITQNVFLNM